MPFLLLSFHLSSGSPLLHLLLESPYHPVGQLWSPFPEKVQEETKAAGEKVKQTGALWNHVSLTQPSLDLGPTHTEYSHDVKGIQAWETDMAT